VRIPIIKRYYHSDATPGNNPVWHNYFQPGFFNRGKGRGILIDFRPARHQYDYYNLFFFAINGKIVFYRKQKSPNKPCFIGTF